MIKKEKYKHAIYVIHLIMTNVRFMAYKGEKHSDIATILDYAENLPRFLISEDDETDTFVSYIEEISKQYPSLEYILDHYKSSSVPEIW